MNLTWGSSLRLAAGAALLGLLAARLGAEPFLAGVRAVDLPSVAAALGLTLLTTVCCAWRWCLVARGLGVGLRLGPAVGAYYRSQLLNTVLPGGVLGDVHRAVSHGRTAGDVGRGLRAVAWERSAGQVVQVLLAVVVLLALPSPVRPFVPAALVGSLVAAIAGTLLVRALARHGSDRSARVLRAAADDVRGGLLARHAWPGIVVASTVVVAGHTATLLVAARAVGVTAPTAQLLPLLLLVLLAMAVPTNIGGWGPREGAAAALFGLAGLGAAQGLAAATAYGVLVLVGTLPGVAVLLAFRGQPALVGPVPPVVGAGVTPDLAEGGAARG